MVEIAAAQILHYDVHQQRILVDVHDPRDVLAVDPVFHRSENQQLLTEHRGVDVPAVDDFDREDLARGYLLAEMHDAVATFAQRV